MHTTITSMISSKNIDTFLEALPLASGAGIVIGTLFVLWGVCELNAKLINLIQTRFNKKPVLVTQMADVVAENSASPVEVKIRPEVVVVIAAAVAATMKEPFRIISVKKQSDAWEKAGRHSILGSHRLR